MVKQCVPKRLLAPYETIRKTDERRWSRNEVDASWASASTIANKTVSEVIEAVGCSDLEVRRPIVPVEGRPLRRKLDPEEVVGYEDILLYGSDVHFPPPDCIGLPAGDLFFCGPIWNTTLDRSDEIDEDLRFDTFQSQREAFFMQEHPATPDEAFQSTPRSLVSPAPAYNLSGLRADWIAVDEAVSFGRIHSSRCRGVELIGRIGGDIVDTLDRPDVTPVGKSAEPKLTLMFDNWWDE